MIYRRSPDDNVPGDIIMIRGLRLEATIGVTDEERAVPQPLLVDLELVCSRLRGCQTDQLADTVDYGAVAQRIAYIASAGCFRLLERLADEIATDVLALFTMTEQVTVTIFKPQAPVELAFEAMGVRIVRRRDDLP